MIRHFTFDCTPEEAYYRPSGSLSGQAVMYNPWEVIHKLLEEGNDTYIWVVTQKQLPTFMERVQKYDLEKFLTLRMDGENQGVTNHNYPDIPRKLKLFVMKGAKQ